MAEAEKRERIMRAAEKLFTNRRLHEITLDDVARTARVGKGTIYLYFTDKDDLFFQTATSGFDELCEIVASEVPADAPFARQLTEACRRIGGFFRRRRQLLRMIQNEESRLLWLSGAHRDRWMERRKKLVAALGRVFAKGVAEGRVRTDVAPETLATLLLGLLRTRARDLAEERGEDPGLERLVDLFCHGACPPETT